VALAPDRVWLADITYIPTAEGWLYLAAILDMFSRRIVGWAMDDRITQELTLSALRMAIATRHPKLCSMSRKANCWDNAPIESFFGNMKTELDDGSGYETRQEARNDLFQFIEGFYNRHRLHSAIGYITPIQKEQFAAAA
jgi:putative transposase